MRGWAAMAYKTPPCRNPACDYFKSNRYVKIKESDAWWSFFCEACRRDLQVITKEGFRRDPDAQGLPSDVDDLNSNPHVKKFKL